MKRALLVVALLLVLVPPLYAADTAAVKKADSAAVKKADTAAVNKADTATVKKVKELQIVKNLFGTEATVLEAKDLGSIYEIVASFPGRGKQIVYVTKDGLYLLAGANLINKEKENLTKKRYDEANKVDVAKLPLQDAILIKKGTGAKKLIVFTDVDCPFCKKSYDWLKTQTDYSLYVFLFPLAMHPSAPEKSVKILCDADPGAAFDSAEADRELTADKCETGEKMLQKHKAAAAEIGVDATPLFITDSGIRMSGFNQKAMEEYLKQ
jgi:thiol:disulfide interchange protein DsbC